MVTREQIENAFSDDAKKEVQTQNIDCDVRAITLLREKIPYDVCKRIIGSVEHDIIYLCSVEEAMPYLSKEDLKILNDCNIFVEIEYDCFAFFV